MFKFTKVLDITEGDTVGTAIIKGATKTYVKSAVLGAIGLGTITYWIRSLSKDAETEEVEEKDLNEQLEENWEEIEKEAEKQADLVESL